MNTIFSFSRFTNYIKRNLIFSKGQYLYLGGLVAGTYVVSLLFYMLTGWTLSLLIQFGILVTVAIGPCMLEPVVNKYNGVMEYTFPVSSFERFLHMLCKYVIILPLLTFGIYYLLNGLIELLPFELTESYARAMEFGTSYKKAHALIGVQSVFLLGYLTFHKYSFLKTNLTVMLLLILALILGLLHVRRTFIASGAMSPDEMGNMILAMGASNRSWTEALREYFLYAIFPVGMWIVSFFRIREKEI